MHPYPSGVKSFENNFSCGTGKQSITIYCFSLVKVPMILSLKQKTKIHLTTLSFGEALYYHSKAMNRTSMYNPLMWLWSGSHGPSVIRTLLLLTILKHNLHHTKNQPLQSLLFLTSHLSFYYHVLYCYAPFWIISTKKKWLWCKYMLNVLYMYQYID